MSSKNYQIDNLDKQILSILMKDASISYTDIASKLFVSSGTIHVRMKKLGEIGIAKKPQLKVNYDRLDYDIMAFLGIFLTQSSMYELVCERLRQIPEMLELHYTTGNYSMFAKIVCKDTNHLREVLHDKIQAIEGIQRTETLISLEESINRPLQLLQNDE